MFVKLWRKELDPDSYDEYYLRAVKRAADIFDGENPDYVPIKGWSGGPLRGALRVLVPEAWASTERRETFRDNFIAIYLDMLAAHLSSGLETSGGDDEKLADYLRPHLQMAVRVMTGTLQ